MMDWDHDELFIDSYKDMRLACDKKTMEALKAQGWEVLTTYRLGGQRRYTLVLPDRPSECYGFSQEDALERFRQLLRPARAEKRQALVLPLRRAS